MNLARALLGLFTHVSVWENNLENIFSCYCYMRPFWYYKKAPVLYTIHNNSGRRAFVLCCRLKRRAEGCARRRFCGGHLYIQHIDTHKRLVLYVMTTVLLHSSHHHRRDCVFHFPRRPNSFPRIGSNFFFFFNFFPVGTLGVYSLRVEVYTIGFIYRLPHSFLWGFTRKFFFFNGHSIGGLAQQPPVPSKVDRFVLPISRSVYFFNQQSINQGSLITIWIRCS